MAKKLSDILAESFDTGDPRARKKKWYVRKIDRTAYGRFVWNTGKQAFKRRGGRYTDKGSAVQAAKISAL